MGSSVSVYVEILHWDGNLKILSYPYLSYCLFTLVFAMQKFRLQLIEVILFIYVSFCYAITIRLKLVKVCDLLHVTMQFNKVKNTMPRYCNRKIDYFNVNNKLINEP